MHTQIPALEHRYDDHCRPWQCEHPSEGGFDGNGYDFRFIFGECNFESCDIYNLKCAPGYIGVPEIVNATCAIQGGTYDVTGCHQACPRLYTHHLWYHGIVESYDSSNSCVNMERYMKGESCEIQCDVSRGFQPQTGYVKCDDSGDYNIDLHCEKATCTIPSEVSHGVIFGGGGANSCTSGQTLSPGEMCT